MTVQRLNINGVMRLDVITFQCKGQDAQEYKYSFQYQSSILVNKIIRLKMKRISLLSPEQIRKHLANHSPSRFVNSFTKSKRFISANPECKQAYYSSTSSLSKRKSTIGNSKRLDFTKSTVLSPASSTYNIKSQFSNLNKTYSFALGRQSSPERSILYTPTKNKVPGPGTYQNQARTKMTISYTMRPKTLDKIAKNLSYLQSPGPGQYQSIQLNPHNGRFSISQFSDTKMAVINRDSRFKKSQQFNNPGPNVYTQLDNFSNRGKYTLSQRRGKGTRPFDKERKFTINYWKHNNKVPGPGTYQKPSEFGLYGDYNYYKSLRITH